MADAAATLLHAIDVHDERPSPDAPWAFVNARPLPEADRELRFSLACEQVDRVIHRALSASGWTTGPMTEGGPYRGALVLAGKQKAASRLDILRACRLVEPGAPIHVAGDKTLGIASLRGWVAGFADVTASLAKNHAIAFRFVRPADLEAIAVGTNAGPTLVDGRFRTVPGAFSPERIDPGSAMLADLFGERLTGDVADLGAGWGYLSVEAALRGRPSSVTLVEAHHGALQCGLSNMAALAPGVQAKRLWLDLTGETLERRYDAVVMNPPFHAGRAADATLGQSFVRAASAALKPGGRLLMVANRKLPYEDTLSSGFRRFEIVAERGGYKLIAATR